MAEQFIDLHCHSTLKPYSKSFKVSKSGGNNSSDSRQKHSIWHQKKPSLLDKLGNFLLSITKFTQSDFTTADIGGVRLILVSIDPMEKNLVLSKKGKPQTFLGKLIKNFITGIGMARINYLTHKIKDDYFTDLIKTRNYLLQLNKLPVNSSRSQRRYELLQSYPSSGLQPDRLYIVFSVEGGHVFNTNTPETLANVALLKSWNFRPCWVSLAHHFPNRLCGRARSFKGLSTLAFDQKSKPDEGITALGSQVIEALLDTSESKKRILIDVKHMNLKSRLLYYQMADISGVPIVVSHGALMFQALPSEMNTEINFYDEEVIRIARSEGIFGVQLDQRRIKVVKKLEVGAKPLKVPRAKRKAWKAVNGKRFKGRLYRRAYYIWKQISHMAELLNAQSTFQGKVWDIQAIGSDFDGIVDPLNGFWTHSEYKLLAQYIKLNVEMYITKGKWKDLHPSNQLGAQAIVEKICVKNAEQFLSKNFN